LTATSALTSTQLATTRPRSQACARTKSSGNSTVSPTALARARKDSPAGCVASATWKTGSLLNRQFHTLWFSLTREHNRLDLAVNSFDIRNHLSEEVAQYFCLA